MMLLCSGNEPHDLSEEWACIWVLADFCDDFIPFAVPAGL